MARVVRFLTWFAVLALLTPATTPAGGLVFSDYAQGVSPGTNGLRGAVDVAVHDDSVYVVGEQDENIAVWHRDSITNQLTFVEVEEDGVGGVDGLRNPTGVAITADGYCVYVSANDNPPGPGDGTVVVFSRGGGFGGPLTFVEVKEDDVGGVTGIGNASGIVASLDGKHIYVVSEGDEAIAIFSRTAPACALTFVGMVQNGVGGVQGLGRPQSIDISPFGDTVYASARIVVGSESLGTVVAFDRDDTTGALTFLEFAQEGVAGVDHLFSTVSSVAVSGFGNTVYATSQSGDAVVVFSRDLGTGSLTYLETERRTGLAKGFKGASDIVESASGDYVFVTGHGDNAIAVFKRDLATGALDFLEVHADPVPGTVILGSAAAVAIAYDFTGGVFVASTGSDTLTAFTADRCGNGATGVDEQCDDGCLAGIASLCEPVDDGDGCSSSCRLELCGPLVSGACHAATPLGGARLDIKDDSRDSKDTLKWSWKGETTPLVQFGDPVTTASYVVCIYDGSGNPQPLLSRAAMAAGICNGKPCWLAKPTGYQYSDKLLTPDGMKKMQLKEGLVDGKPSVKVQGAGIFLDPPVFPLTLPVTVQVKNSHNGECWQASYSTADKNDFGRFSAKSD